MTELVPVSTLSGFVVALPVAEDRASVLPIEPIYPGRSLGSDREGREASVLDGDEGLG